MQSLVLEINIHGQHIFLIGEALGNGKDPLPGDSVQIGITPHNLPLCRNSLTIPVGTLILIGGVPLPWIHRHDFSIDHRIDVHQSLANDIGELGKIACKPALNGGRVSAIADNIVYELTGKGKICLQ